MSATRYQGGRPRESGTYVLEGFSEDAVKAMTENPEYFCRWYTAKSFMLVGALAYIAYLHGSRRGKKS